MSGGCVYGCNHPLWGGSGGCFALQANPIEYKCSCGDGFVSEDSLGRPSCVSKLALTSFYASVGLFSGLSFMFLLLKAYHHGLLPEAAKETRRAKLCRRLIAITSFYSGSASIAFIIAAARAGTAPLLASGMLQALYVTSFPAVIMAVANITEIWMETLPTQMMPPNSPVARWKGVAEKRDFLCWAGLAGMVCCIPFGVSACFQKSDALQYVRAVNFATGLSAILSIGCFISVATKLTRIINSTRITMAPSGGETYYRALTVMWSQVLALSTAALIWIVSLTVLELTAAGQGTPVLYIALMVTDADLCFCLAVYFCKVSASRTPVGIADRSAEIA